MISYYIGDRGLPWRRRPCEVWIPNGLNDGQQTLIYQYFFAKVFYLLSCRRLLLGEPTHFSKVMRRPDNWNGGWLNHFSKQNMNAVYLKQMIPVWPRRGWLQCLEWMFKTCAKPWIVWKVHLKKVKSRQFQAGQDAQMVHWLLHGCP